MARIVLISLIELPIAVSPSVFSVGAIAAISQCEFSLSVPSSLGVTILSTSELRFSMPVFASMEMAIDGSSSFSLGLLVAKSVEANIAATSGLLFGLEADRVLDFFIDSNSDISTNLIVDKLLDFGVSCLSSSVFALVTGSGLGLALSSSSGLAFSLGVRQSLEANLISLSETACDLFIEKPIAVVFSSASAIACLLTVGKPINSVITATSTTAFNLVTGSGLNMMIAASAVLGSALTVGKPLATAIAASSNSLFGLMSSKRLELSSSAQSGSLFAVEVGKPLAIGLSASSSTLFELALLYAFTGDNFDGASLNNFWTFVNPTGTGTAAVEGGDLRITSPGSTNLFNTTKTAPRVIQDCANTDFDIYTKTLSRFDQNFEFSGIYIEADDTNWLRFEHVFNTGYAAASRKRIWCGSTINGTTTTIFDIATAWGDTLPYLRVNRSGNVFTFYSSTDGTTWTQRGTVTRSIVVTKIGLHNGLAASGTAYAGRFAFFSPIQTIANPPSNTPPTINLWYGASQQSFGALGQPQTWVNLLGNVTTPNGVSSVTYSLNGGSEIPLTLGTNSIATRRLAAANDINVDLATSALTASSTTDDIVTITAKDVYGLTSTQQVTVKYTGGTVWAMPYSINWSTVTNILDVAQPVDGHWGITGGRLRTLTPGYDRLVAIGDVTWTNYEITVPITVHALGVSNGRDGTGVGILTGWRGHSDSPVTSTGLAGSQPKMGWLDHGVIAWFRNTNLRISDNGSDSAGDTIASQARSVEAGKTYIFKLQVEEVPSGGAIYRLKVWEDTQTEPVAWDLTGQSIAADQDSGSIVLLAHEHDVSFGNVQVRSLTQEIIQVESVLDLDSSIAIASQSVAVTATLDLNPAVSITPYVSGAFNNDEFSGSSLNNFWTFVNSGSHTATVENGYLQIVSNGYSDLFNTTKTAPRIIQDCANTDFDVYTRLLTELTKGYDIYGIYIEADASNWIRFDYFWHQPPQTGDNRKRLYCAATVNNSTSQVFLITTPFADPPPYLRVNRTGNLFTFYSSVDGTNWTQRGTRTQALTITKIGLHCAYASGGSGGVSTYTGRFEFFRNYV